MAGASGASAIIAFRAEGAFVRLLKRRPKSFDIQVQDMTLHITASDDLAEESRAAALSFWEQLESYALRYPEFSRSKRPLDGLAAGAPRLVREMLSAASAAAVGPMFTFRGAVVDHVGRFLAESAAIVTTAHAPGRRRAAAGSSQPTRR